MKTIYQNTLLKAIVMFALLMNFSQCKKDDINENKFKDFQLTPEMVIPIAKANLNIINALPQDSNIKYDADGLIRFIYRKDSIASFPADSFVKIPQVAPVNNTGKLGLISVSDFSIYNKQTLTQLSAGFDTATRNGLTAAYGSTAIFPALNSPNLTLNSFPAPGNFTNVTFSNGSIVMEFRNRLPVTITNLTANIYSSLPVQTLIGVVHFLNVAPGTSKIDSINLAGKTLSSSITYNIPVFISAASPSPVLINGNDSIAFAISSNNLKASSGSAIFPSQSIPTQTVDVALNGDDPSTRIRNIAFRGGSINYSMSSSISERIDLNITFVGATKNGSPMPSVPITLTNNNKTGTIDLTGVNFDLTQVPGQAYNKLRVQVTGALVTSNTVKTFDSSNAVAANFTFGTLLFKSVDGYLGSRVVTVSPGSFTFDAFKNLNGGLRFDNPVLTLTTHNSIGVPIELNLDIEGASKTGLKQKLNGPTIPIAFPTIAQRGQTINGTFAYNKTNSQLVDLIALPPSDMNYSGSATINKLGFTGYNDFIDNTSAIAIDLDMNMPFSLKSSDLSLLDTIDNPLVKVENGNVKFFNDGIDTSKIEYIDLITKIDNGFPFDGGMSMFFQNDLYNSLDSVLSPQLLYSAIPDANGRTAQHTISVSTIRITKGQLSRMVALKETKMLLKVKMNTFANGTTPVKVYSDYNAAIGMSVKIKLAVDVK